MGKCATKKTRGYALGGSLMDPQDPLGLIPAPTAPKPSPLLQQLDQKIAMNTAIGDLSNTERYQMANPGNQPYKAGGAAPGSSADASQLNQQNSILASLRKNIAGQGIAAFADGGAVKETTEQLMARMAAKYGVTATGTPSETPDPAPAAPVAVAQEPKAKGIGGIIGMLQGRKAQIDKAISGYANGGKIQGPGTATSDSIPAEVEETGEPIAVSNKERIVSEAQDNLLQLIAKGVGFKSLDAMLEAGTGKPVGPTVKGGKRAAGYGGKFDLERDYSIPQEEQASAQQAIANRVPSPQVAAAPIDRKAIFQTPDFSMIAADPKGYEKTRQAVAPEAPTSRQAVTAQRTPSAVEPGMQERTFGANSLASSPMQTMIAQANQAPLVGGELSPAQAAQREQLGMGDQRFVADAVQPTMKSGAYTIGQPSGSIAGKSPVDATQMSAPVGGGYVTNKQGKAMYLPPQATTSRDPNRAYDSHGNDMTYTNEMKSQLADMERARYGRDMQSDIKDPRAIAIGKLNTDRMNAEQTLNNQTQQTQQQAISAGFDQQLKGRQVAQLTQDADLRTKVMEGDPKAIETWNRLNPRSQQQMLVVPGGKTKNAMGDEETRPSAVFDPNTRSYMQNAGPQAEQPQQVTVKPGMPVNAPDGTHTFQGKTVVVKGGKVMEVK